MTIKEELYRLVDELPESELHTAKRFLEYLRNMGDPVLRAMLEAPEDDEPETEEERVAIVEAQEDFKAGRVVSHEELKREFGLGLSVLITQDVIPSVIRWAGLLRACSSFLPRLAPSHQGRLFHKHRSHPRHRHY